MGIEELTIKGFRSLRDVTWKPGKLNVVIGPNGSGKSNLLRGLDLLHAVATGNLGNEILRDGGIAPLLWDRQRKTIEWKVKATVAGAPYAYEIAIERLGNSSSFRASKESLSSERPLIVRTSEASIVLDKAGNTFDPGEMVSEEQPVLPRVVFPSLVDPQILSFQKFLANWAVYPSFRVDQDSLVRQAVVARFEQRIAPDGQNLVPVLHTLYSSDRKFKRSVDAAMRAAFGRDYEELLFPPAARQRVQLGLRWRSLKTEQSAADLSDGTLRFLLLIAILTNPEPSDLIAIDEPETGLHPGMLPLVAELAAEAAERTQVIFTTHSPQFLDAFEGDPPTTTVAQWEDGATQLSVLDGEELRRWLTTYSLGSMFISGELEGMA
jgi:predicted ATPase